MYPKALLLKDVHRLIDQVGLQVNISNGKNSPGHVAGDAFFGNLRQALTGLPPSTPLILKGPMPFARIFRMVLTMAFSRRGQWSDEQFNRAVKEALATFGVDSLGALQQQFMLPPAAAWGVLLLLVLVLDLIECELSRHLLLRKLQFGGTNLSNIIRREAIAIYIAALLPPRLPPTRSTPGLRLLSITLRRTAGSS